MLEDEPTRLYIALALGMLGTVIEGIGGKVSGGSLLLYTNCAIGISEPLLLSTNAVGAWLETKKKAKIANNLAFASDLLQSVVIAIFAVMAFRYLTKGTNHRIGGAVVTLVALAIIGLNVICALIIASTDINSRSARSKFWLAAGIGGVTFVSGTLIEEYRWFWIDSIAVILICLLALAIIVNRVNDYRKRREELTRQGQLELATSRKRA